MEAVHAGRDALGVEYESRWSDIADANLRHARTQGAPGRGGVIRGDATSILSLVPAALTGQVARDGHPHRRHRRPMSPESAASLPEPSNSAVQLG